MTLKRKGAAIIKGNRTTVLQRGSGEAEVVKDTSESPSRNERAHSLEKGYRLVGLSKGVTVNLGHYESARIDVWMSVVVEDTPEEALEALAEISGLCDEHIAYERELLE